jgi:hypothetical protein
MPAMQRKKQPRRARPESPEDLRQEFLAAVSKLWPVAGGSLSLRKSSCIRERCTACESGMGHPRYGLWGRSGRERFSLYIAEELVPELEQALLNGQALQQLVREMGVRYTQARRSERSEQPSQRQSSRRRKKS